MPQLRCYNRDDYTKLNVNLAQPVYSTQTMLTFDVGVSLTIPETLAP
jgi:hypothetical protein